MSKAIVLVSIMLLSLAFPLMASAQEEMGDKIVCDSTLIALLYIAEYEYGFHAMSVDAATLEKGVYAPLFDDMMTMMEDGEMADSEDMMMDSEDIMMEDGEMMTLAPGVVADENESCTALRAELEGFLYTYFSTMMMEEEN